MTQSTATSPKSALVALLLRSTSLFTDVISSSIEEHGAVVLLVLVMVLLVLAVVLWC